ncbi:hypothetical protein [Adhaeribacter pallidiroseus]|nr:hypothetical protein [Adhaeribacter pallidiroseus]
MNTLGILISFPDNDSWIVLFRSSFFYQLWRATASTVNGGGNSFF